MANEGAKPDEFDVLCRQIGLALITWQDVETAHFRIFFKLLGAPEYSLASIVYHQNESFDARHTMVGRLVQHSLKGQPELLKLWDDGKIGLYKNVKDATLNRNKLAHYTHEFMVSSIEMADDGGAIVRFDQPRLQPSPYNMVSRLLGRTPDKDDHNLSAATLQTYVTEFVKLVGRLDEFWAKLPHPLPNPNLEQVLGPPPRHIIRRQRQRRPTDDDSSGDA